MCFELLITLMLAYVGCLLTFNDNVILLTITQDPIRAIMNFKKRNIHSFIEDIFCARLINISENAAQIHNILKTRDMAHPINMLAV